VVIRQFPHCASSVRLLSEDRRALASHVATCYKGKPIGIRACELCSRLSGTWDSSPSCSWPSG
jgi:hypothetical protein